MDDQSPPRKAAPHDPGAPLDMDLLTGLGTLKVSGGRRGGRASRTRGSRRSSGSGGGGLRRSVGGATGSSTWLFFGIDGRIARKTYWLGVLVYYLAAAAGLVVVAILSSLGLPGVILAVLAIAVLIGMVWASVGVTVKRWHDRDKSGWWIFIGLIPLIGPIWSLVEPGFLRGTPGPNRFGAEPVDVFVR